MAEQMTVDPPGRQRYIFPPAGEAGDSLRFEGWVDPGGNVPPHIHPTQEERFEIVEGEMTFTVGRGKRRAGPGEAVVVPPGTRHAFRNAGTETVHMWVEVTPPESLQEFLEDTAALGRAGLVVRMGPLRLVTPRGIGPAAVLLHRYRPSTLILMPPPFVQRLLLDPIARRVERRGYARPA